MKIYLVLAAGGSGTRMHYDQNKVFIQLCGRSILERSIRLFEGIIDGMVLVCKKEEKEMAEEAVCNAGVSFPVEITEGGDTRQHSVLNGLKALKADSDDIVLVHDAARCLTPRSVILEVIDSCNRFGSGIPGIPAVNTMKYSKDGMVVDSTVDRMGLYEIQTPQGFRYDSLYNAYLSAYRNNFSATDDASVMEFAHEKIRITSGSKKNIKITEKDDLMLAEAFLTNESSTMRIGMGFDVHRLVENRRLILCGVEIPYHHGLLGHSDADVALHALMDAMLGAASLGDIGKHFPDTAEEYKGISSILLLEKTMNIITDAGFRLINADITIIAQQPKLAPYMDAMRTNICRSLQCDPGRISVKATTTEKLGFEGRQEGISAQAVCLLQKKS